MSDELVAVLGGGQLGRMLGLAGIPLGLRFRFLDPVAGAPAGAVGGLVVGDLGDEASLLEVATDATVVTYEWEGVPAAAARFLAEHRPVRPGARSLEVAQDRIAEKETFRRLGIATPAFAPVSTRAELEHAVGEVGGLPAVLKTRRGGYDGKGQWMIRASEDLDRAWADLGGVPLILEAAGAVRPRAVGAGRARRSEARSRAGPWSRTATSRASCGSRVPPPRVSRRRSSSAPRTSPPAC